MTRFVLGLVLGFCSLAAFAADEALPGVRGWAHAALAAELQKADPDLNLVASMSFPVVTDLRLNGGLANERLLEAVAGRMRLVSVGRMDCTRLTDLYVVDGIMRKAGLEPELGLDTGRLRGCLGGATLFDLMNALIFTCGYSSLEHHVVLPGALQRLGAAHRGDGAFVGEDGREWFFLDSHGLLAMHLCGGDPAVVVRSRLRLEEGLPWLQRHGMIDELVEVLLFLRLTGAPARDEAAHLRWLADRRQADGGLCVRDLRGCRSHWHPVSLYFQLLLEDQQQGRTDAPG